MSDFNDRPFVAGSLVGHRAFAVDSLGRLVGPSHGGVFKPGENVGACIKYESAFTPTQLYLDVALSRLSVRATPPPQPKVAADHRIGSGDCTCGYYAYFDGGPNPYAGGPGRVDALIEGYGTCTVGQRGFRAEKARLVALVDSRPRLTWWDRHGGVLLAVLLLLNVASLVRHLVDPDWWAIGAGVGVLSCCYLAWSRGQSLSKKRASRAASPMAAVLRNYPDVPVYPSIKAATAAHPLTPPPAPTPETDDDFWERSAS